MITSIHSVTGQETRISSEITQEVEFLSSTLSLLRDSEKISNDEFLEAGLIQGGLNLLSAMISNGVEAEELEIQITSLKDRALLICQRFPNMDEKIEKYILDIIFATRFPEKYNLSELKPLISFGASPRGSINLALAAKCYAFINRRGFVIPDDVRAVVFDVLQHRIGISYEAEAENMSSVDIIAKIVNEIAVP